VRHDEFIDRTYNAFQEGPSYVFLKPGSDRRPAVICTYLYNIELQSFCIMLTVVIKDLFVESRYLHLNLELRTCCKFISYASLPQHIGSSQIVY